MRYVVTGLGRSGTSMMMHCLKLGGMECIYDPEYFPYDKKFNPDGYYEVPGHHDLDKPEYDNKVIKLGLKNVVCNHPTTVIFMYRNHKNFLNSRELIGIPSTGLTEESDYWKFLQEFRISFKNKFELIPLFYEFVTFNPEGVFNALAKLHLFPIDPEAAAKGVRV